MARISLIIILLIYHLYYIKDNIYNKYLFQVFEILEDNNVLSTLLEIKRNNYKSIERDLVEKL